MKTLTLTQQVKTDIAKFVRQFGVSRTALGLNALNNPHTVNDFLEGERTITLATADALYSYMRRYKKEYDKNVSSSH